MTRVIGRRNETGASLVEAAFALPIFFLLLFGLIDFGLQAFENNQATNAARDGARVGVINYRYLDAAGRSSDPKPAGTRDYDLLKQAIEANLPGRTIPDSDLDVRCITPAGADTPCVTATVDVDRVSVRVRWDRNSVSPIAAALGFATMTADGEARMTIIGAPISGTGDPTPVPCDVLSMNVPSPVERTDTGQLAADLTIESASVGTCGNATLEVVSPALDSTTLCSSNCVGSYTYSHLGATPDWVAGEWTARFRSASGDELRAATFLVEDPVVACDITSVSVVGVSPPITRLATNYLSDDLTIQIEATGTCTDIAITLTPPGASSGVPACTSPCPMESFTYPGGRDRVWNTPGVGSITAVSATSSASNTFTVNDTGTCTVAGEAQYDPVSRSGTKLKAVSPPSPIRQRIFVGKSGPCASIRVRLVAPNGTSTGDLIDVGNGQYEYTSDESIWTAGVARVQVNSADVDSFTVG